MKQITIPQALARITCLLSLLGSLYVLPTTAFSQDTPISIDIEDEEEPPLVLHGGVPLIMITINDVVGDFDVWDAHTRERVLRLALQEAIDESKLPYAYSLSFRPRPRQKWIPELSFEIIEWRLSNTDAFVCQIDAEYYDAAEERHDLKGAFGVENPLNISSNPHDIEEYMKDAASKAFLKIMRRIRQKGLYRTP